MFQWLVREILTRFLRMSKLQNQYFWSQTWTQFFNITCICERVILHRLSFKNKLQWTSLSLVICGLKLPQNKVGLKYLVQRPCNKDLIISTYLYIIIYICFILKTSCYKPFFLVICGLKLLWNKVHLQYLVWIKQSGSTGARVVGGNQLLSRHSV